MTSHTEEAEIRSVRLFVKSSIFVETEEISQASFKYRYHFAPPRSCRLPCTMILISLHFMNFCFRRMEFQHGLCLPVPQLASICDRLCTALCVFRGSPHLYARKPTVPAGGIIFQMVFRFESKLFLC